MSEIIGKKRSSTKVLKKPPIELPETENPFISIKAPPDTQVKQIWSVGGGKGGVGKSLISSSLAISLAQHGHRIVAIDMDLGGANLHTALGAGLPKKSLSDFLDGRVDHLQDCVTSTGIPNLGIISGAQDSIGVPHLRVDQKVLILQDLFELETDYILLDLGAGTHVNTVDFFTFSDIRSVVILPEPTSIENAYRFIKSAFFRYLEVSPELKKIRPLIEKTKHPKSDSHIKSPADLYREVKRTSPESARTLKKLITQFRLQIIMNQTRTQTDIDIGHSIKSVCKKYFGFDADYIGFIDYDSGVWQAVRRKKPFAFEFPNSQLVSSIDKITQHLIKRYGHLRSKIG